MHFGPWFEAKGTTIYDCREKDMCHRLERHEAMVCSDSTLSVCVLVKSERMHCSTHSSLKLDFNLRKWKYESMNYDALPPLPLTRDLL